MPGSGIGVYLDGSLPSALLGKGTRVLELGLASLAGLRVDEFRAVLAHEYGHFGHGDTRWSSFSAALGNSLLEALREMPGPGTAGGQGTGTQALFALNPAYWILRLFHRLYTRVTNKFSRLGEVRADAVAVQTYGSDAFASGLTRLYVSDRVFTVAAQPRYIEALRWRLPTLRQFSTLMDRSHHGVSETVQQNFAEEARAVVTRGSEHDSHPPIGVRLQYARLWARSGDEDARSVTCLFDNWDTLDQQAARLYNQHLTAVYCP